MVGHLGTEELAALAIAAALLAGAFTLFNFLTYGTTAQVARLQGAGHEIDAGRIAAQALWLSAGIGLILTALLGSLAAPLVDLMGADGRTRELAVEYLRIGSLGLPFALIALAGQGYLRGMSDLRTPLVIVVVANLVNVVLNVVFIYGFDWGLAGSAWATVVAQAGMGAAFVRALLAAPADSRRPSLERMRPLRADWRSDLRSHCGSLRLVPGGRRGTGARGRRLARGAPDRLPAVRVPGPGARRDRDRRPGDRRSGTRRGACGGGVSRGATDDRVGRAGRSGVRRRDARARGRAAARFHR